jgi:hypothetical protein
VRSTRIPSAAKTASNATVNFASPIPDQKPELADAVLEAHDQVAGLLRHPLPGWMRCHPKHVDPAAGHFDHEQHVQPLQEDGVHGEKSTASTSLACARRNCRQETTDRVGAGSTPARSRMAQTVLAPILPL